MGKRIALILCLVGFDAFSKAAAFRSLMEGAIPLFTDFYGVQFSLDLAFNSGVAWGFFAGHAALWFVVRLALMGGLLFYLTRCGSKWEAGCLLLILAGALGNTADFLIYGHVVDFLHFVFWGYSFPIFNFADSYVTLGALGFLFESSACPIKRLNG